MPNNILLCCLSPATTHLSECLQNISLAGTKGYYGVRIGANTNAFGNNSTGDTTNLLLAMDRAVSVGLSKFAVGLSMGPKFNGTTIVALNGGVPLAVPVLPTATGVLDWLVTWWQTVVDDCRAHATFLGKTPTTFLEFQWINELNKGGNQDPHDVNSSGVNIGYVTYPGLAAGEIPSQAFTSLYYIASRVTFYGIPTIGWNFEGQGTTTAQAEMDSFTGANAANIVALCTKMGTNRYADAPASPYSSAVTKAAFSVKVQAQLARMTANALIGSKARELHEFGLDKRRAPSCTAPNTIRDDLLEQVKSEAGITEGSLYCAYDLSTTHDPATVTDARFYCWDHRNSDAPLDGVDVAP